MTEKWKSRLGTLAVVVVTAVVVWLGMHLSRSIEAHNLLARELTTWVVQQRQLMLQQAQRQGLIPPVQQTRPAEEVPGVEDDGTAEAVDGGAAPRRPE